MSSDTSITADPPVPKSSNRSAMLIVFMVVFIDLLGFGIVLPLLPRFANSYIKVLFPGANQNAIQGAMIGLLMSSFSLMQFIFAPIWGRVSDRIGRRPILLLGLAGSVVFYALFGYASSLPEQTQAGLALVLLFIARIGAGIAGATIATAQAVIADCTPPEKRKHGMALIGAAFGIGFTFGPLIGFGALRLFPQNHEAVGYAAATLSLIAFLLGLRMLPETRLFNTAPPLRRQWLNLSGFKIALSTTAIAPVILVFFLATLGFSAFEATLSLLLGDVLHLTEDNTFLIFAYIGVVLLITQGYLYRKLASRVSEATFMTVGILLMGTGVGLLGMLTLMDPDAPLISPMVLLYPALTVAVIGFAFLTPSAQALISRRTDDNKQGEILGINQSAASMARILGPGLGLPLYKLTDTHMLPYALGAAVVLAMLPLMPRIRRG